MGISSPNLLLLLCFIVISFVLLFSIVRKQRRTFFSLLLLILLFGVLFHLYFGYSDKFASLYAWGSDDAYISYRYASNLVQGHGMVYNVGERVEGYTNFMFVLIMAVGVNFLGEVAAYPFACFFNLLIISVCFSLFYKYLKEKYGEANALLGGLMFVLCPPLWLWAASGTEAVLVLFIQVAIYIYLQKVIIGKRKQDAVALCGLMVLSVLVRADGFILPLVVVVYLLIKKEWRLSFYCLVSTIVPFVLHATWRYSYYGYLLPNTYYAKVSGPLLLRINYAINNLPRSIFVYLFIFIAGLMVRLKNALDGGKPKRRKLGFIYLYVFVSLLYWIYIGGDFYQERFLIVLLPLGIIVLIDSLFQSRRLWEITTASALVVIIQLMPLCNPLVDQRFAYQYLKYDSWITLGKFLKIRYPGKVMASSAAGKIPYYSGLKTIDALGLNDKHIGHQDVGSINSFLPGHNKTDPDYVLSRKPDLIIGGIDKDNLDLYWGIKRVNYKYLRKNGYNIRYLVNINKMSNGKDNIVDVKKLNDKEIKQKIKQGYYWSVFESN